MASQLHHVPRRCERSVVTAYQQLRKTGISEMQAFQSCITLYRIYHPEASINEARLLVSEWIDHYTSSAKYENNRGTDES